MQKQNFVREDYLISSKLIILIWVIASIVQLILSAIKMFIMKTDIHPSESQNQYKVPPEQNENKQLPPENMRGVLELQAVTVNSQQEPPSVLRTPHLEKSVFNQDITIQSTYKGRRENNEKLDEVQEKQKSKPVQEEIVNFLEKFIDKHLPRLSILKTAFFLTVFNVLAYFLFAVLFNELRFLDSQQYGSPCQQLIHLCMLELFLSFLLFPDFQYEQQ